MPTLKQRWSQLWQAIGMPEPAGVLEALLARYSEPQRHYHTQQHLEECLARFDELKAGVPHPAEVELALWYHDAIYEVTRHDNEARSAELAQRELLAAGIEPGAAARIHDLIMQTRHDALPVGADAQALVDADLSILAAAPARFDEYERQIRAEYAFVPDALFTQKRRAILESFLARPAIFCTPAFRVAHEDGARANLRRSLAS